MKLLVIGDSCIDKYIYGKCDRLSPEAPVPVFVPSYETTMGGMAQNVYNNVKQFYSSCDIITNQKKPIKTRIIEERSNHMIVRIDEGDNHNERVDLSSINFKKYNATIVTDYDKGFLNIDDLQYIARHSKMSFIDSKKILSTWVYDFSFIKVNHNEYLNSKFFIDKFISSKTVITLGIKGCIFKGITYPPLKKIATIDVSGAGDTFLAAFSAQYLQTRDVVSSIDFAQKCCCQVIQKRGTCVYDPNMD